MPHGKDFLVGMISSQNFGFYVVLPGNCIEPKSNSLAQERIKPHFRYAKREELFHDPCGYFTVVWRYHKPGFKILKRLYVRQQRIAPDHGKGFNNKGIGLAGSRLLLRADCWQKDGNKCQVS